MSWYRVGSSNCSSHNLPQIPTYRLPLLCRYVVGFPRSTCGFVATSHGFIRKKVCIFTISLQNLRNYEMPFGSDAWRLGILDLDRSALSDVLSLFLPVQNCSRESSLAPLFPSTILSVLLAVPAELVLHVQNDFPFAPCSLQTLHRVISSMTMTSVKSVFPSSLCKNSAVHACSSETCSLILKQFCFKLLSVKSFFGIEAIRDEIEPLLLLIWIYQSATTLKPAWIAGVCGF